MNFKYSVIIVTAISLITVMSVFIGSAVIAQNHSKPDGQEFPQTQYNGVSSSSNVNIAEVGVYKNGENQIVINTSENGFIEGNIISNSSQMSFSGQCVDKVLRATGSDNFSNTVEVTLIFDKNTITASSKLLIRYEESTEYLNINGKYVK